MYRLELECESTLIILVACYPLLRNDYKQRTLLVNDCGIIYGSRC
jgi:hypothetical protein